MHLAKPQAAPADGECSGGSRHTATESTAAGSLPVRTEAEVRGYRCSKCQALVSSAQEAVSHCQSPETEPLEPPKLAESTCERQGGGLGGSAQTANCEQEAGGGTLQLPCEDSGHGQASSLYLCPDCQAPLPSVCEAVAHCRPWLQVLPWEAAVVAEPLLPGSPLALDVHGRPSVSWYAVPETGSSVTLVRELDGAWHALNSGTVVPLLDATDEWLAAALLAVSDRMLHGLVHAAGRQLLEGSWAYHSMRQEWECLRADEGYAYFGVASNASDGELDNAYRRLARQLHPDKNGGTEAAKEEFQAMKERYEALKQRRGLREDAAGSAQEAAGAAEEEEAPEQGRRISYDPADRDSMASALQRLLPDLRSVRQQTAALSAELLRLRASTEAPPVG